MNKVRLFAIALLIGVASYAQDIAHINVTELVNAMPETKAAEEQMKKILEGHEAEIKKQQAALDQLQKDAEEYMKTVPQDVSKITDAMRTKVQSLQTEYQEKAQKLGQYQQTASEDVSKKRLRLIEPIEKKVGDAINAVAARKGIKYVLDVSQPGVIYYNGGVNIIQDVKKELGI